MSKITLVLAGNYKQFKNFLNENKFNFKKYKYIARIEDLKGYYDVNILKIGTWWTTSVELLAAVEDLEKKQCWDR